MANNAIAIAREQKIFCVKETTKGTLVAPTSGSLIIAAGYGQINQQPSRTNSNEIQNSRDVLDQFLDRTPAGTWSFPVYMRPSGTAGTAPQEDVLLECLMGTKTVSASTSVTYSQATTKSSFSLWMQKDHTVFWASGASIDSMKAALATTGGATMEFAGKFMQMGWAGTSETDSTISSAGTSVSLGSGEAKKFSVGSYIEFEESGTTLNNSDAGYRITAVNTSTDTLTITPGAEEEITSGSVVRGWLPDGTEVGNPLANRLGVARIDGTSFNVQSMSVNVNDPCKYLDDEITTSGYVEDFVEEQREITYDFAIYFRENDLAYFYDGYNSDEKTLSLVIGTTAGSIVTIYSGRTIPTVPQVSESDPTVALQCSAVALGTSGEDSLTITYT